MDKANFFSDAKIKLDPNNATLCEESIASECFKKTLQIFAGQRINYMSPSWVKFTINYMRGQQVVHKHGETVVGNMIRNKIVWN